LNVKADAAVGFVVNLPPRQAPSMAAPSWHAYKDAPLRDSLCGEESSSLNGAVWLRYCADEMAARARVAAKVEVEKIVRSILRFVRRSTTVCIQRAD
jgi:hypothetical protein